MMWGFGRGKGKSEKGSRKGKKRSGSRFKRVDPAEALRQLDLPQEQIDVLRSLKHNKAQEYAQAYKAMQAQKETAKSWSEQKEQDLAKAYRRAKHPEQYLFNDICRIIDPTFKQPIEDSDELTRVYLEIAENYHHRLLEVTEGLKNRELFEQELLGIFLQREYQERIIVFTKKQTQKIDRFEKAMAMAEKLAQANTPKPLSAPRKALYEGLKGPILSIREDYTAFARRKAKELSKHMPFINTLKEHAIKSHIRQRLDEGPAKLAAIKEYALEHLPYMAEDIRRYSWQKWHELACRADGHPNASDPSENTSFRRKHPQSRPIPMPRRASSRELLTSVDDGLTPDSRSHAIIDALQKLHIDHSEEEPAAAKGEAHSPRGPKKSPR